MDSTTKTRWMHTLLWLGWFLILLALSFSSTVSTRLGEPTVVALVVTHDPQQGPLFPWQPRGRWRKWAWRHYQAARRAYHRARWAARLARLVLAGTLCFATLVDWLTRAQLRRHLGALPVLYSLLEILQVRAIINRHCPTAAKLDYGTVALVLILNRLMAPRPLYKVADWLAQTILVQTLGVSAAKFNDDRLGRMLDALAPQARAIWLDVVHLALVRFDIDLHFLFYDLTAFVMHGEFPESKHVDYGFAHNTPSNKQKLKLSLDAAGDGAIPTDYGLWSGRTADVATVQHNMERLCELLRRRGYPLHEVMLIGDRANLNDELALAYDTKGLKYLAGVPAQKKEHVALLVAAPEAHFADHPLESPGYFGLPCQVTFTHDGRTVTHRGLVVLSGPMRTAVRQGRAKQLRDLGTELLAVQSKIGQKRYRSVKEVQARADTCLRRSAVGRLMRAEAYATPAGGVGLRWAVNRLALLRAMQADGRYLLATNDWTLSPARMLALYRAKDAAEKRFEVAKQDLRVAPLYVHSDARIESLLLLNMLALLAYSLLERQVRGHGLALTTRRIIEQLETLAVIETHCWDGSVLQRLTPQTAEQCELLAALEQVLAELVLPHWLPALPAAAEPVVQNWLPPPRQQEVA